MSFAPNNPTEFGSPFTHPHKLTSGGAGILCNLLLGPISQ
jgi:hypothetical protein